MIKKLLILLLLLFLVFMATVLFNQQQIMHPKRRTLQAYHYKWLEHPEQHSMKIIKIEKHPEILIVKFNANVLRSKRAKKIETELLSKGYSLEELKDNGIMMLFHGKNGRKEDLLPVAERYVTAGFTCILVDLPAHGENLSEKLRYGQGLDASLYEEVLTVVQNKVEVKNQPLYFWGMSLGGAYAISSSQHDKRVFQEPKAVILVATFDKLSHVLKEKSVKIFGDYLGKVLYKILSFSLQTFYNFDPEKADSASTAQTIDLPVFMLHGKKDELIGYQHGKRLFQSFHTKKKEFHLDEQGNHHNILVTNYPFYLESIDFLLKLQHKN